MLVKDVEEKKIAATPVPRPVWPRVILYLAGIIALIATTLAVLKSDTPPPGEPSGIFETVR